MTNIEYIQKKYVDERKFTVLYTMAKNLLPGLAVFISFGVLSAGSN